MREAMLAVRLVEDHGYSYDDAMDLILEQDPEKAAKKMAKNAAPDDPEKQKELESKYKEKMMRMKEKGYSKKKKEGMANIAAMSGALAGKKRK